MFSFYIYAKLDFRGRSLLWRGLALPRPAHGRRFLTKASAISVGFWGSTLLYVPIAKGPRLLQTPSTGNLGLYRFLLSAHTCIEVTVFIELYVEKPFFREEFLHVSPLLGRYGVWR